MTRLIEWFTSNSVAANLLMGALVIGGLLMAFNMKQEVFPEFELEAVNVNVAYPGASPSEVENGILAAVEESVNGIDGVRQVVSAATEGSGTVTVQLDNGADVDQALADVKSAVDRIQTFPEEAERPTIASIAMRSRVMSVLLSGDQQLTDLQRLADHARDQLVAHPDVTVAEISGLPDNEVSIEIPAATLQAYGLTLADVGSQVAMTSVERPGGSVETRGGDLMVRVSDRRQGEADFADIPIRTTTAGGSVRLGDIATITEGFVDSDAGVWFDGERAVRIDVFRVGNETPSQVSAGTREVLDALNTDLPESVSVKVISDDSQVLAARLGLLLQNAGTGLVLVFIVLALFLDLRVAVWVAAGIPIAFLGAFLVLPLMGVSINMISLFALLVVLGLVVDDAIVVGEQIAQGMEEGKPPLKAAVGGTSRMVGPIVIAVLTTVLAFAPMFGVPGVFGKVFSVFPIVVSAVLLFSMIESFFILPAHLAHGTSTGLWTLTDPIRKRVAGALRAFIDRVYAPAMERVLDARGITAAAGVALLLGTVGVVAGGWVPIAFFPQIGGETVTLTARLPSGTATDRLTEVRQLLEQSGRDAMVASGDADGLEALTSSIGVGTGTTVTVELALNSEVMHLSAADIEAVWTQTVPPVMGAQALTVSSVSGPSAGAAVEIQLSSLDPGIAEAASRDLQVSLATFADLSDIDTSLADGADQIDVRVNARGEALGLTSDQVSRQIRGAYQGSEALRELTGRTERAVRVRLPLAERTSEAGLLALPIRIGPGADYVSLSDVVELERTSAPAQIQRQDGRRQIAVTAELAPGVESSSDVTQALREHILPDLESRYPGLSAGFGGQTQEMADSMSALIPGFVLALFAIYGLLASNFRSYIQPVIVMSAIPFGIVGAVFGHLLLGWSISMISMFGIIALAGVVVNDSLVLVDAANERLREGDTAREAILWAGARRFRPILLTSLTTFLGLFPMIFETSVQAAFLVPMAISLGFGILFATVIVLVLVPAFYLLVEDVRGWFGAGQPHVAEAPVDGQPELAAH